MLRFGKYQLDITKYEKQTNLRIVSLKFKPRICCKPKILLSSFDSNAAYDIIVPLPIHIHINVISGTTAILDGIGSHIFFEDKPFDFYAVMLT